jgi:hypothetical protein
MSQESDPLFGKTWREIPDRSTFSTEFAPSDETRVYEPVDGGYKLTVSGTRGGREYSWHYTALYDGKPHPVHGRSDVDAVTIYKLDDRTTVGLFMKQLSPGGPYARQLSEDGQTLTVQAAGRNTDGTPFFDVIEYSL